MAAPVLAATDPHARTRLIRGCAHGLPWELWRRTPHPELFGSVRELWAGLATRAGEWHRSLPNGEAALMIHLGAPQRLTECDGVAADARIGPGFVSGLQERPNTFECLEPATRVVAARLSPLGAFRVLGGLPQRALRHRVVEIDAVLDARAGVAALRERMLEAAHLGEALDLLEDWLLARARSAPPSHPALDHALALVAGGTDSPRAIADACGLSPRRLREIFDEGVGVSPKRLARILRFRRTLDRLAAAPDGDLAGLALASGYYDQAHLYRDFRALAGLTPRAYLRALGGGDDGVDVIGG